ncbi:MAG: hypothetical protein Kow00121_32680 [Elainellaceae cyanobacterium]
MVHLGDLRISRREPGAPFQESVTSAVLIPLPLIYTHLTSSIIPFDLTTIMRQQQLVQFLQTELAIPSEAIALALRNPEQTPNLLPMVLWQYGLITIDQLDKVFEWMETA